MTLAFRRNEAWWKYLGVKNSAAERARSRRRGWKAVRVTVHRVGQGGCYE